MDTKLPDFSVAFQDALEDVDRMRVVIADLSGRRNQGRLYRVLADTIAELGRITADRDRCLAALQTVFRQTVTLKLLPDAECQRLMARAITTDHYAASMDKTWEENAELGRVKQQRDALAAALQRIEYLDFDGHNDAQMLDLIAEFARAALAKLEKEGSKNQ